MTALRKYLPCDHKDQFHVDRFDAFLTFIDALNAPVPDGTLGAGSFSLTFGSQTLRERQKQFRSRASNTPPALTDGDHT